MSRLFHVLAPCAVLAFALGAAAWGEPAPQEADRAPAQKPVSTVTVVGRRAPDKDLIKRVIAPFVDVHAARDRKTGLVVRAPPSGICPITLGLSPAFNAFVTARIEAVANAVGSHAQLLGKCEPNVEVVFTTDPQGLIDALAKRTGGRILGLHYAGEREALARVTRPIQGWYMTGTVNLTPPQATRVIDLFGSDSSDNNPLSLERNPPVQTFGPADVVMDSAYWPDPYSGTGSRLRMKNSSQLMNVLIVADLNKLDGAEIGPLSDYVAMLSLTWPRSLDACNTLPSILDMFAADCRTRPAPQALTDSDLAFLKALYGSDITTSGDRGRDRVAQAMAGSVAKAEPPSARPPPKP